MDEDHLSLEHLAIAYFAVPAWLCFHYSILISDIELTKEQSSNRD
jgi:hypothetical protein